MLINEVTTNKPAKPKSPQQQRVAALKRQLDQAKVAARRQQLADRQATLNQQRAALGRATGQ